MKPSDTEGYNDILLTDAVLAYLYVISMDHPFTFSQYIDFQLIGTRCCLNSGREKAIFRS